MSPLNIMRIMSHRSWKLSTQTLVNVYRALIGSVLDYSSFTHSLLSEANKQKLQVIQNTGLRIIFHLRRDTSVFDLGLSVGLHGIYSRHLYLTNNYLCKAIQTNNKLITNLFEDFIYSYNSTIKSQKHRTPLCTFFSSFSSHNNTNTNMQTRINAQPPLFDPTHA